MVVWGNVLVNCCLSLLSLLAVHSFLTFTLRRNTSLNYPQCYNISVKLISGVQAVCVTLIAARTIQKVDDIIYGTDPLMEWYISLLSGYFLYDLYVMYKGFWLLNDAKQLRSFYSSLIMFANNNLSITLHHLMLGFVGLPIMMVFRKNLGLYFFACICFAEISTPFYSIRAIMHLVSHKSGTLYKINGLCFIFTFFAGRICVIPFLYYKYSRFANIRIDKVPFEIPLHCNVASVAFHTLQVYWFCLILRSAAKHLKTT